MNRIFLKYITILILLIIYVQSVNSQTSTLYYLSGAPQSYYMNPATQPGCNFFIGAPIVSSFQMQTHASGLGLDQIFYRDSETDSIILFTKAGKPGAENFINGLNDVNYLGAVVAFNFLSMGFRARDMYITFDITAKQNEILSFPKELVELVLLGNEVYDNTNLNSFGIDFTSYNEIAIGVSKKFNDQISIGIRPKILFGLATLRTSNTDMSINTNERDITLKVNTDVNIATSGINVPLDENGNIDFDQSFELDPGLKTPSQYAKVATENKGFGIDLGITFRPIERIELSASVLDLGYINWKHYSHTIEIRGEYVYEGAPFNLGDSTQLLSGFIDSLKTALSYETSSSSFKTTLNPKIFFGGRYFLTKNIDVGAMSRFDLIPNDLQTQIMLLANWRPSQILNLSATYNILNNNNPTLGLGISLQLGPLSFYLISDNIPLSQKTLRIENQNIPVPELTRTNVRVGFNLVFGNNKRKKLMQDKPMYFSGDY